MSGNEKTERSERGGSAEGGASGGGDLTRKVERSFTCTLCGFATTREVGLLRAEVQEVCLNCEDWAVHAAEPGELAEAAREAATELDGPTLTERQALAYLLREALGVGREVAAGEMDSSPSNVDNLHRRATEKVEDAKRVVGALDALRSLAGDERDRLEADDGTGDGDEG